MYIFKIDTDRSCSKDFLLFLIEEFRQDTVEDSIVQSAWPRLRKGKQIQPLVRKKKQEFRS